MTTPQPIRVLPDEDRRTITGVVRGTAYDGRAVSGEPGGIRVSGPSNVDDLSMGRDDVYAPTDEREWDPVSGRDLVVYHWERYADFPWPTPPYARRR
jgi:hypothetical protein